MPQLLPIHAAHGEDSLFVRQPISSQQQIGDGTDNALLQGRSSQAACGSFASTERSATGASVLNNITRVDGKGLWRSWKRNFNSQVRA